ncbi:hypothetical protein ACNH6C_13860 [Bdellovibrio bacteriovorus]|uniref:hypothetical protein n=1 Tax=Bdellovibrio bacteriovorus TaxID=959 RepID=UPI003A80ADE6
MKVYLFIVLALSLNLVACGDSGKGSGRKPAAPEAVKQSTACERSEAKYIKMALESSVAGEDALVVGDSYYLTIWDTGRFEAIRAMHSKDYKTVHYDYTVGYAELTKEQTPYRSFDLIGYGIVNADSVVADYFGLPFFEMFDPENNKKNIQIYYEVVEEGVITIGPEERDFHCNDGKRPPGLRL